MLYFPTEIQWMHFSKLTFSHYCPSAGATHPLSHQPPFPGDSTSWCGCRVPPTYFQDLLSFPFLLISTPLCQLLVCRNTFYQGPPSACTGLRCTTMLFSTHIRKVCFRSWELTQSPTAEQCAGSGRL